MKKILTSLLVVGLVAGAAVWGTSAFFRDSETSTGNVLSAGSLDLTIDSTAHYAGLICVDNTEDETLNPLWQDDPAVVDVTTRPELLNQPCVGTFEETDLDPENLSHRFFDLTDLKPGDEGENTISVHVDDNDAWFRAILENVIDSDNGCTEPELDDEPGCTETGNGELDDDLTLTVWLDQGSVPGFQNNDPTEPVIDSTEGDNIRQEADEPLVTITGEVTPDGIVFEFADYLAGVYASEGCTVADGHTDYGSCHGLASDGRVVGSAVYYFGVGWTFDDDAGNQAQTDLLGTDVSFEVEQHRNNPTPFTL